MHLGTAWRLLGNQLEATGRPGEPMRHREGVPRAAKRHQVGSGGAQELPSRLQERPRRSQSCPRRSKRRPRSSKLGSKDVQELPKTLPEVPKTLQEASKSHKTAVQVQVYSKQCHLAKTMVYLRKIKVFAGLEQSRRPAWRAKSSPSGAWRRVWRA